MVRNITYLCLSLLSTVCWAQNGTLRQQSYPLAVPMTEQNTEWRKDLYREIILTERNNAALYSPPEWQEEKTVGLFALIVKQALQDSLTLYKYEVDGNERFTEKTKVSFSDILDNFHIFYKKTGEGITVDKNDLPYAEVTTYYVKEAIYYDLSNSSFRRKVVALCPVLVLEDDFGEGTTRYPMFWVLYDDLQPLLKDFPVAGDIQTANRMTMDEYFTLNKYEGKIYKEYNIFGNVLSVDNDSIAEIRRDSIAEGIRDVRNKTYNVYHHKKKPEPTPESPKVKEKVKIKNRYWWIFPWQKKKALDTVRKEQKSMTDSTSVSTISNK